MVQIRDSGFDHRYSLSLRIFQIWSRWPSLRIPKLTFHHKQLLRIRLRGLEFCRSSVCQFAQTRTILTKTKRADVERNMSKAFTYCLYRGTYPLKVIVSVLCAVQTPTWKRTLLTVTDLLTECCARCIGGHSAHW